jgi:hypothetical protein
MSFDVEAATAAYIDGLGEEALAQAAAYTTGNQWLMLWGLLISAIVTLIIIRTGLLTKTADTLSKRGLVIRVFGISAVYLVVSEMLEMPWSIFSGWWRETEYGRTSQPLMDFLGQGLLALAISVLLFGIFLVAIYAFIQKAKKLWWLWGGAFSGVFVAFLMVVGPTYIAPLFNDYQPVPPGEVRDAVEAMASMRGSRPIESSCTTARDSPITSPPTWRVLVAPRVSLFQTSRSTRPPSMRSKPSLVMRSDTTSWATCGTACSSLLSSSWRAFSLPTRRLIPSHGSLAREKTSATPPLCRCSCFWSA